MIMCARKIAIILHYIYMFKNMFLVYVEPTNIQHVTLHVSPTCGFAYMPSLSYLCAYYIN